MGRTDAAADRRPYRVDQVRRGSLGLGLGSGLGSGLGLRQELGLGLGLGLGAGLELGLGLATRNDAGACSAVAGDIGETRARYGRDIGEIDLGEI